MTENSKFIVSTTMTIVIATTLGNGLLTLPFLTKMGMVRGPNAQGAPESDDEAEERESWKPTWKEFDRNWMQYYFGGKHNPRPARAACAPHQVAPEPTDEKEMTMGFKEGQYCYAPWSFFSLSLLLLCVLMWCILLCVVVCEDVYVCVLMYLNLCIFVCWVCVCVYMCVVWCVCMCA